MPLRALLFDLDETLMIEHASIHSALDETCSIAAAHVVDPARLKTSVLARAHDLWHASPATRYGRAIGASSWEALHADFAGEAPELRLLREWIPECRRLAWSGALAEQGAEDPGLATRLADAFVRIRKKWHVKYPETDDLIARLRPRFRLGLITNGASDIQREKIRGAGLESHFEAIVVSGDVGSAKPDPRVFHRALELLRSRPEETLMIGNSLECDIAGARAPGISSIWVDRENRETAPPGCRRITDLRGLVPLLERV